MNKITIDKSEYNRLLIIEAKMIEMEANGVDNWEGYGCMCYNAKEKDCCIFRTEDELKYLGLTDG